ncbi:MAG TPA: hypothetical protein VNY36_08720 [Bacteroidia bacterium]|jgi:hypothetical protein|nr:hypothetical protein [Bacteroidia bacterium]
MGKKVNMGVYKALKVGKFIKFGIAFCFINLLTFNCCAQVAVPQWAFIHKGLLSATGTFAIGAMPENNITNAYLTGNIEYYTDDKISIRGDGYFFLNSLTQNSILKKNEAEYFGAFYHFHTSSNFDPLIGIQPGLSYTQMLTADSTLDKATLCPLASVVLGFNFFGEKYFHIQVNVRYTIGEHLTEQDGNNISELSFNFGLGWNFDLIKKSNKR